MARVSGKTDGDGLLPKLGGVIRAERLTRGLSQEELAHASGIDRSHMGKIERGERNVTILNLARIARVLKLRPSSLMDAAGF